MQQVAGLHLGYTFSFYRPLQAMVFTSQVHQNSVPKNQADPPES